jgi:hypothetical protein
LSFLVLVSFVYLRKRRIIWLKIKKEKKSNKKKSKNLLFL